MEPLVLSSRAISSFVLLHLIMTTLTGLVTVTTAAVGNHTDRLALLAFKDLIDEDPSRVLNSWNDSFHFCHWSGVTCSRRHPHRVTALDLSNHGLVGAMSPHIANLTFLRDIDLSNNSFRGVIPQDIGRLFRLHYLFLEHNSMEGEIPANLTHCKELREVFLYRNNLKGSIPIELGSLPKLRALLLDENSLTGRIPPSFGNLSSLLTLSFSQNGLEGSIPDDLGRMNNIGQRQFDYNRLSGALPPSFYNLSSLWSLSMAENDLHGQLPPDLGMTLPNLEYIAAPINQFSGHIPVSLSNASSLELIDFTANQLSGFVPMNLGNLKRLKHMSFIENRLTSKESDGLSFITSLTNCSVLETLYLTYNKLSGALPPTVANLSTHMEQLLLGENRIFGTFPSGIENLVSLNNLKLDNNFLTGNIPVGIGKLRNLQGLYLHQNTLKGQIPSSLGNLTKLTILNLCGNQLEGVIPSNLGGPQPLEKLNLCGNKLNGSIPARVMSSSSMIEFAITSNFFTGSLPLEIGNMKNLQELNISNNRLIGEIPSTLGNCLDLRQLSMGENFFEGYIPSTLSTLRNIESIDVSRNNFSGKIPNFLEKFLFLRYLNLSFNNFEGEVPKQGVFENASAISVAGNKKLCGGVSNLHLQSCPKLKPKKRHSRVVIPLVTSVAVLVLCLCSFGILYWLKRLRKKPTSTSSIKGPHLNLSYAELLKATNGFSPDNLIGVGGYGSVYKGSLEHIEEVFAVKVLNLQLRGAFRSFMAECKVMRNIRHRNLVKLLTVCSSIDFNGNDFKALVMEYMPNGSLENWLHQVTDGERQLINLNFIQRLNIAIDVASALDYLHHHYGVPVVHRDLKPSNVLLDGDMVAHVSDFGLAKFLLEAATNCSKSQTSSVGIMGTVGYVAPEYGTGTAASTHGDMYSYGVLLLEMFTGRKPTDNTFKDSLNLHQFVKMAWPDRVLEIADPRLLSEVDSIAEREIRHNVTKKLQQCLVSVIKIGMACSADSLSERMDMGSVAVEMHAVKNLYLGFNDRATMPSPLDEGPSYLSNY